LKTNLGGGGGKNGRTGGKNTQLRGEALSEKELSGKRTENEPGALLPNVTTTRDGHETFWGGEEEGGKVCGGVSVGEGSCLLGSHALEVELMRNHRALNHLSLSILPLALLILIEKGKWVIPRGDPPVSKDHKARRSGRREDLGREGTSFIKKRVLSFL